MIQLSKNCKIYYFHAFIDQIRAKTKFPFLTSYKNQKKLRKITNREAGKREEMGKTTEPPRTMILTNINHNDDDDHNSNI